MTKYKLELWNPKKNQYYTIWEGPKEYAITMINKSYNLRSTRRLVRVREDIICRAKKNKSIDKYADAAMDLIQ